MLFQHLNFLLNQFDFVFVKVFQIFHLFLMFGGDLEDSHLVVFFEASRSITHVFQRYLMSFFKFIVPFLQIFDLNFLKLNLLNMYGNLFLVVIFHRFPLLLNSFQFSFLFFHFQSHFLNFFQQFLVLFFQLIFQFRRLFIGFSRNYPIFEHLFLVYVVPFDILQF